MHVMRSFHRLIYQENGEKDDCEFQMYAKLELSNYWFCEKVKETKQFLDWILASTKKKLGLSANSETRYKATCKLEIFFCKKDSSFCLYLGLIFVPILCGNLSGRPALAIYLGGKTS